jgi:hypothetical protein
MDRAALQGTPDGAPSEAVLAKIRIPFIQRARVTRGGEEQNVFLVDLGLAGVFAEHDGPVPLGEVVRVEFRLPGNEIPLSAACRVAWCHEAGDTPKGLPSGMGLEFVDISDADRERLREHLAAYCRRDGRARRFARQWPPTDAEGGNP